MIFNSNLCILFQNAIFLILLNVKISSPLERFKMKRDELFSKNGDSMRVSWSPQELWNSVSFWDASFTFVYYRRRVFLRKLLSFQISSALSSHFQRTVILFAVRYNFIFCALKIWRQRAENKNTPFFRIKGCGDRMEC